MNSKTHLLSGGLVSMSLLLTACGTAVKDTNELSLVDKNQQLEQKIIANNQAFESEKLALMEELDSLREAKLAAELAAAKPASLATGAQQQAVEAGLFPPNAKLGHCYSRVLVPAQYRNKTDKVMVQPAGESVTISPAEYKTLDKRVLVSEASETLVVVPATYKTITEKVLVNPAHTHLKTVPAVYETITERVMDKPAHTVWKRGAGFQSSALETRIDNGTGEIMCLVEVPATYKTVTKRVLKTAARSLEEHHDAEYKTITKRVVDRPASTKKVVVPAKYRTIKVRELVVPEREVRQAVAAVYKDVTSSTKIADSELKWEEVLCEDNMTRETVARLQRLLQNNGHYRGGPIDGVYGPMTERAVNAYAKANNLPTGSRLLSLRTAKHIGLEI